MLKKIDECLIVVLGFLAARFNLHNHSTDELHLMSFMSPKYFLKILLKRLILSSCKILKKNDGLERRESEYLSVFFPRNPLGTASPMVFAQELSMWLRQKQPNQKNPLYLITDNKNIA